jgi:hypothetical protein
VDETKFAFESGVTVLLSSFAVLVSSGFVVATEILKEDVEDSRVARLDPSVEYAARDCNREVAGIFSIFDDICESKGIFERGDEIEAVGV